MCCDQKRVPPSSRNKQEEWWHMDLKTGPSDLLWLNTSGSCPSPDFSLFVFSCREIILCTIFRSVSIVFFSSVDCILSFIFWLKAFLKLCVLCLCGKHHAAATVDRVCVQGQTDMPLNVCLCLLGRMLFRNLELLLGPLCSMWVLPFTHD